MFQLNCKYICCDIDNRDKMSLFSASESHDSIFFAFKNLALESWTRPQIKNVR